MITSLINHDPKAFIYIFPFDENCYISLKKLDILQTEIISLDEFENEKLKTLKSERTRAEYCWTCTPHIIKFCIENRSVNMCTYLDSDLYFFSNPDVLFNESPRSSVLITEHKYSPEYDQSLTSGKYCVQFITFKSDQIGRDVLNWWGDRCLEWCYNRFEDNKFGDQKYLDDWLDRFDGIHVIQNLGSGIAPWNIQQYEIEDKGNYFQVKENITGKISNLIFYHFHEIKLEYGYIKLKLDYVICSSALDYIHRTYFENLRKNNQLFFKSNIYSEKYKNVFEELIVNNQKLNSLLWEKEGISNLYFAENGIYDHSKEIKINLSIDEMISSFKVNFLLPTLTNITEFNWMPIWRSSFEILIEDIYIISNSNECFKIEHFSGNFQIKKSINNFIFLNNHGIITFKCPVTNPKELIIQGKWKLIKSWESYVELSKLLNEKDKIINSRSIRFILYLKNFWFIILKKIKF